MVCFYFKLGKVCGLTTIRDAGRTHLIDDHKLKKEMEETNRAALYVS
jgi:hypothetical protein